MAALAVAVLALPPAPTHAGGTNTDSNGAPIDLSPVLRSGTIGITLTVGGSADSRSGSGPTCRWVRTAPQGYDSDDNVFVKTIDGVIHNHYSKICPGVVSGFWIPETSVRVGAAALRDAVTRVLPAPTFGSAPPASANIVKYDTWLWSDPTQFVAVTATATIATGAGAVAASVTATPLRLVFDPGEPGSQPVVCQWPGRAWTPADGNSDSDCMYAYRHSSSISATGTFAARWSTVWSVTWTSSAGGGGTLDAAYLTTTDVDIDVKEVQAIVTG
jgi:hypothetical protein